MANGKCSSKFILPLAASKWNMCQEIKIRNSGVIILLRKGEITLVTYVHTFDGSVELWSFSIFLPLRLLSASVILLANVYVNYAVYFT